MLEINYACDHMDMNKSFGCTCTIDIAMIEKCACEQCECE